MNDERYYSMNHRRMSVTYMICGFVLCTVIGGGLEALLASFGIKK
jgi:hypothetical protein